jgi:hypothetical protein
LSSRIRNNYIDNFLDEEYAWPVDIDIKIDMQKIIINFDDSIVSDVQALGYALVVARGGKGGETSSRRATYAQKTVFPNGVQAACPIRYGVKSDTINILKDRASSPTSRTQSTAAPAQPERVGT